MWYPPSEELQKWKGTVPSSQKWENTHILDKVSLRKYLWILAQLRARNVMLCIMFSLSVCHLKNYIYEGLRVPFANSHQFSSVQSLSYVQIFVTHGLQHARLPCPSTSPGACSNSCSLSWWCNPIISFLSSPSPAFNSAQHQGLFSESVLCIRWPKYWHFSFSISPSDEYWGLISFRTDLSK